MSTCTTTPLSAYEPCARDAQLAAAACLEAACWPERHAGGAAAALPELRRAAALRRAALLLRHDGAAEGERAPLLGFVLLTWAAGEGRICKLAVVPSARRQGHGAALLAAALEVLRAEGAAAASLHVDAGAGGAPARALYRRFGFAAGGTSRDYYGAGRHALLLRTALATA